MTDGPGDEGRSAGAAARRPIGEGAAVGAPGDAAPLRFEDLTPGAVFPCGARRISEADIVAFARQFDPQAIHLDRRAAEASLLRGMSASGWHTAGLGMRMLTEAFLARVRSYGSPGVSSLRWLKPVRPDAPLSGELAVLGARRSRSRPDIGLLDLDYRLSQNGEIACRQRFTLMVGAEEQAAGVAGAKAAPPEQTPEEAELAALAREPVPPIAWRWAEELTFQRPTDLGAMTLTREQIVAFARAFDPQPFHLSDEGGRAGFFGALSASGWHTAALFMRSLVLSGLKAMRKMSPEDRAAAARAIGPGLGFDDLRWRRPAFAGDTLRFFIIPRTVAPFPGRADWRRLESQAVVLNQDDAVVMSMTTLLMSR